MGKVIKKAEVLTLLEAPDSHFKTEEEQKALEAPLEGAASLARG